MLERTFVHIPRVGYVTERRVWEAGIDSWEQACQCTEPPPGLTEARWEELRQHCAQSRHELARGGHHHFSERLAARDQWRAWPSFRRSCAYLDIETTGLGPRAYPTVVGIYDGSRVRSFIAGEDLDDLPEALEQYSMIVTFNGTTFDLPFIRRAFPALRYRQLHVDLRYVLARLGHRGGLKAIERRHGLEREGDIASLDGFDAVRLWDEYRRGSESALELLVRYNAADVENLEPLMEYAYAESWARLTARAPVSGDERNTD